MANKTCEHSMCSCSVGDGESYCSPQCDAAAKAGETEISCGCEHAICKHEIDV